MKPYRNPYTIRPAWTTQIGLRIVQLVAVVVVGLVAAGGTALACRSKVDPERTERVLRINGYTDVRPGGWSWRCSDEDWACTEFEATAPNGQHVQGVVGCGVMGCGKGCTVRVTE